MAEYTYERLIKAINEKSKKGLLAWAPSSYENTYQTVLGHGIVMVMFDLSNSSIIPPYEDVPPIASLTFLNERGEVFNRIECYTEQSEYFGEIKEIYAAAYNSYMKTDETLKSMIEDLESRF